MRKVACLAVFMALMMLVPVQAGENVSIQQSQPQDDPRQPSKRTRPCTCFGTIPTQRHGLISISWITSLEEYFEEKENGVIDIDLQFRMDPMLDKRLIMDTDGLFRGSFSINVEGDWTNDNDQEILLVDRTIVTN